MTEKTDDKLDTTLNYSTECAALNMSFDSENFQINDETSQLQEQLSKFIELVPHLKQINNTEKIRNILCSSSDSTPTS